MTTTLPFAVLFAAWSGRKAPVLHGRIWPAVAEEAEKAASFCGLGYSLRCRGFWEAAALLDDERLREAATEEMSRREALGWSAVTAAEGLPDRMKASLGRSCPPLLWARGELSGLRGPLVAIVGSRSLSSEEAAFALSAGEVAAGLGLGVVSGGARGSDALGVEGALSAGGFGAHYLPGGLPKRAPAASALLSRNPGGPEFDRLEALARNRWVYASAHSVVLVSSRLGVGGSWMGAIAAKRSRLSPLIAFLGQSPSQGNEALARLGVRTVRRPAELEAAFKAHASEPARLAI